MPYSQFRMMFPPFHVPCTVGVIGLGYVGLPLALVFADAGQRVVGFDIDPIKVDKLARGESYIQHIGAERIREAVQDGSFAPTADFSRLGECDALIICVPTPLGRHREPDNSFIQSTAREIAHHLRPGQLVVLESTTYPGATEDEVLPILKSSGLRTPHDFLLAYSPEREDPGNAQFTTKTIPKIVAGVNPKSTEAAVAFYATAFDQVVPVSSPRVAEATKMLENLYRAVNIALVNELKVVFDQMGIDVWEVIDAASTKPFGFTPFYPGPGLGGHCIPVDPFYLSWKAAEYGLRTRFVELAGEINTAMPAYVVAKVIKALNEDGRCLRGARVLVLGLAYKADVDDDRESPAYEIIDILRHHGARVAYCDPHIPESGRTRKHDIGLRSEPVDGDLFATFDALVLCTAHKEFMDPALYHGVRLVVDTRNVIRRCTDGFGPQRLVLA